ncbi:MAG: molybdenum cofactor biosynthesis protein MoaE [Flavobacteriales bacterium]|nr:molybdenum cofactor biosynthesis protein MoaE [Flavobacteriales bacterium]
MNQEKKHKVKDIFVEGPIDPTFIATSVAKHATRMDIGAHEIFLGQVRADEHRTSNIDVRSVIAIEYTAYRDMALERMTAIREEAFTRWPSMTCLHVHHSLGVIPAGQLCFMVFASAPHRMAAREAVAWVVDRIKADLPIFGREVLSDSTHVWKVNRSVDPSGRPADR